MGKVHENSSLNFKWLKRGVGKNEGVQFYESFIYYGVKYMLYDCVYMYNEGLREPHIGKLTKAWECLDKTIKVEVHWFFRPKEISKWLGETKTLENEIFFANGQGRGLANVNPLEAIVGLCNVVCISKDERNPQPLDEQLKAADFVFYRTFDVHSSAISDKMDDNVGGLEIKYVFNREECVETSRFLVSIPDTFKDDAKGEPQNKDVPSLLQRNTNFKESDNSHVQPLKKIRSNMKCVEMKVGIVPVEKVENKERNTTPTCSDKSLDQASIKLKPGDIKPPERKHVELKVACASERVKEMFTKTLAVDSKSKHDGESPADVNDLKASGTFGTTEDCKKRKISAIETSDDFEGKKSKKTRNVGSFVVSDGKISINTNASDLVATSKVNSKSGIALSTDKDKKDKYREFVVSSKPNAEASNRFKRHHWEEKLQKAYDQGRAVLLYNVDHDFSSLEVEGIIWHAFRVNCYAKILPHTSVSSPHYVQALILFETKDVARRVLAKLDEKCLMFLDGRKRFIPLVATPCPPISTNKSGNFFGHLTIRKTRYQSQHKDKVVSTSHFPQPNSIEYDMAMEWRLLQLQFVRRWGSLHEQQGLELENLKRATSKQCA